jgi:hypothetical protein
VFPLLSQVANRVALQLLGHQLFQVVSQVACRLRFRVRSHQENRPGSPPAPRRASRLHLRLASPLLNLLLFHQLNRVRTLQVCQVASHQLYPLAHQVCRLISLLAPPAAFRLERHLVYLPNSPAANQLLSLRVFLLRSQAVYLLVLHRQCHQRFLRNAQLEFQVRVQLLLPQEFQVDNLLQFLLHSPAESLVHSLLACRAAYLLANLPACRRNNLVESRLVLRRPFRAQCRLESPVVVRLGYQLEIQPLCRPVYPRRCRQASPLISLQENRRLRLLASHRLSRALNRVLHLHLSRRGCRPAILRPCRVVFLLPFRQADRLDNRRIYQALSRAHCHLAYLLAARRAAPPLCPVQPPRVNHLDSHLDSHLGSRRLSRLGFLRGLLRLYRLDSQVQNRLQCLLVSQVPYRLESPQRSPVVIRQGFLRIDRAVFRPVSLLVYQVLCRQEHHLASLPVSQVVIRLGSLLVNQQANLRANLQNSPAEYPVVPLLRFPLEFLRQSLL